VDNLGDISHSLGMSIGIILLGLVPLIVFAIIDSFFSLKAALIGASIAVAIEASFSIYLIGEIDNFTLYNMLLIIIFAGLAWKFKSAKFFKMQPAIMSSLFGVFLAGSYLMDQPILSEFVLKYQDQLKETLKNQPQTLNAITDPMMIKLFAESTFTSGILLFGHAAVCAFTALKMGNLAWILARASFYLFLFVAMIWAKLRIM
jgi:hypothetical protein